MTKSNAQALNDAFHELEGLECWAWVAGRGTGSVVSLKFGEKIKRRIPVTNPHISEEARKFEGEYCLFIEGCAWRIEEEEVLGCSVSSNEPDGAMIEALSQLINKKVVSVSLKYPSFDFSLLFEQGVSLHSFCFLKTADELDNYTLSTRDSAWTVTDHGECVVEPREL